MSLTDHRALMRMQSTPPSAHTPYAGYDNETGNQANQTQEGTIVFFFFINRNEIMRPFDMNG